MISLSRNVRGALRSRQRGYIINPYRYASGGGGGGDPDWASRITLMHFDGADGSTTFTDQKGLIWTPSGNAQIDTAQSVFGGASLLLDGSGDYLSTPDAAAWTLGNSNFFGTARIRPTGVSGVQTILAQWGASTTDRQFIVALNGASVLLAVYTSGQVNVVAHTVVPNVWQEIAWGRDGTDLYAWLDGFRSSPVAISTASLQACTNDVTIGAYDGGSGAWGGHIDELRFGLVNPPSGNYTPATSAFPDGP